MEGPSPRIGQVRISRTVVSVTRACSALAVVALTLFGLLAMHGWASHIATHGAQTAPLHGTMLASTTQTGPLEHSGSIPTSGSVVMDDSASTADGGGEPGGAGGEMVLLGLCLAVLGAFALALVLLLLKGETRLPRVLRRIGPPGVLLSRDRDPPALTRLCVIRC
jgi:hypothetical protein